MQVVYFHIPGQFGQRFFMRLQWTITPLVDALLASGVQAKVVGYHDAVDDATDDTWHIWLCNDTLPPPPSDGYHLLWFCHRMQYPPLSQLREYDAVLTTSRAHANFLRRVLVGDHPVRHVPWPMRGAASSPKPLKFKANHTPLWTTIWSPARGHKLEPAAQAVLLPEMSHHVTVRGTGWGRWADEDPAIAPAPCDHTLIDFLQTAPAFWSIDLLRNRMAGFLDPFALYALQLGCRVYSDTRVGIPAALKSAITVIADPVTYISGTELPHPAPLTRHQKARVAEYLQDKHNPNDLAQNLVGLATQIQKKAALQRKAKPSAFSADVAIVFQDPKEQALYAPDVGISDVQNALVQGQISRLDYVPACMDHSADPFASEAQVFSAAFERLQRAAIIQDAMNSGVTVTVVPADTFQGLQALRATYTPWPIHDLTVFLRHMQLGHDGAGPMPLDPNILHNVLRLGALYKKRPTDYVEPDFEHPWTNVHYQTTNPLGQIKYISARLNDFDPSAPLVQMQATPWMPPKKGGALHVSAQSPVGIFIHAYYAKGFEDILKRLVHLPVQASLYISTDTEDKRLFLRELLLKTEFAYAEIRVFENRGRDIFPKLFGFQDMYQHHDLVLHLHTKRSVHSPDLKDWARTCFDALIGSPDRISQIVETFDAQPTVSMLAPVPITPIRPALQWMRNLRIAETVASELGLKLPPSGQSFAFPAGSMFWARWDTIQPLIDLNLSVSRFPPEEGQEDGTLAHAIERLLGLLAQQNGQQMQFISV